ncbi:FERM and PDZ domain-containing protein 2-like isoform X3 [Cloeon dipterum]|uniref:FERM and PDZ domain-containing protein 2-like isoform X3 n=1 Tax=Cloeon dipterum TaxID=197152 RepID=UPI0032205F6E
MAEVSVAEVLELRASAALAEPEVWNLLRGLLLAHAQGVPSSISARDFLINGQGQMRVWNPTACRSYPTDRQWVCQLGRVMRCLSPATASNRLKRLLDAMTNEQPQNRPSLAGICKELQDYSGHDADNLARQLYAEVMGPSPPEPMAENKPIISSTPLMLDPKKYSEEKQVVSSTPMADTKEQPPAPLVMLFDDIGACTPIAVAAAAAKRPARLVRSLSSPSEGARRSKPVERAPSRLYRLRPPSIGRSACVGPEFVVRSSLPGKEILLPNDQKRVGKRQLTVVLLNGQRLNVLCAPSTVTAANVLQVVLEEEGLKHSFMLGLAQRSGDDLIFLPPSLPLAKVAPKSWLSCLLKGHEMPFTLFVRVQLFPPTLRGVRWESKHLLYLELRRALVEGRLRCSGAQQEMLAGLALQAEFGNFSQAPSEEPYFLLMHYVCEEVLHVASVLETKALRQRVEEQHQSRSGLDPGRAEELFVSECQALRDYGTHLFRASQLMRLGPKVAVRLGVRLNGIVVRSGDSDAEACHMAWNAITKLKVTKEHLVVFAADGKFKFHFADKQSHFVFHLASLHHQFSLRLKNPAHNSDSLSRALGVTVVQSYEKYEPSEGGSESGGLRRSAVSRHNSEVAKQNKENQEQARRPLGVRMGTRAVFESKESLVPTTPENAIPDAYIINSSVKSEEELKDVSLTEERILRSVTLKKDESGSLGIQVTEGSDGAVYIRAVTPGGPADLQGIIKRGDQVMAVGGESLCDVSYGEALRRLQSRCSASEGGNVELVVSQVYAEGASVVAAQVTARYRKQRASLFPLSTNKLDIVSALQKPVEDHYLAQIRYHTHHETNDLLSTKQLPRKNSS